METRYCAPSSAKVVAKLSVAFVAPEMTETPTPGGFPFPTMRGEDRRRVGGKLPCQRGQVAHDQVGQTGNRQLLVCRKAMIVHEDRDRTGDLGSIRVAKLKRRADLQPTECLFGNEGFRQSLCTWKMGPVRAWPAPFPDNGVVAGGRRIGPQDEIDRIALMIVISERAEGEDLIRSVGDRPGKRTSMRSSPCPR